jgi:putative membrane protein
MSGPSKLSVAAVAAAFTVAPLWAFAQQPPEPNRHDWGPYMMGWGGGWYGMILGPLLMILFLAVVIAVAVVIVRGLGGPWQWGPPPHQMSSGRTPLDILKERYARGEINKEEFEERRRVLGD